MSLRPYQSSAVTQVQSHWAAGRRRCVVALPTGSGKTVVATAALAGARRPLALVHTTTLLEQTARRMPGTAVQTIQAALSRGVRLECDRVFADECHHLPSEQWRAVLDLLPAGVPIIGCTATPERADGTALGDCFDALVSTAHYSTLLRGGWLSPCDVRPTVGMDPAVAYLRYAGRPGGGWRPGVLFAPTVAACRAAVAVLVAQGVRAACLDSTTPAGDRKALLKAYSEGYVDLLASPMTLAEGFDAPRAEVCVLARACEHAGTYLQIAGRVLRPSPGKTSALLLDCTGAAARHGNPTIDRHYSLTRGIQRPVPRTTPAPRSTARPVARQGVRDGEAAYVIGRWLGKLWAA